MAPRREQPSYTGRLPALGLLGCCLAVALVLAGCSPAMNTETVKPTYVIYAQKQIPEGQLLDVGIQVFETPEPDTGDTEDQGYNPEIKEAESHYIPFHLKNTLQMTGHWGAVRVTPVKADSVDVSVKGKIIESNGSRLVVQVEVEDASGVRWFTREYEAEANSASYVDNIKGLEDPYQDFYNAVSNDMLGHKQRLNPADIRNIRRISQLKFATDVAPDTFKDYLGQNGQGVYVISRLPSDDDPMMQRVLRVREREYMFIDTVNEYYSDFYDEMWEPYRNWRISYLEEDKAKRELERKATTRKLLGVAAIAAAIAYEVMGGDSRSTTLRDVMVLGGAYSFKTGMDASSDARIHADALRELGESFGTEITPVVMEVEGQTVELDGSAQEQYQQWRRLLREMFVVETGFTPGNEPPEVPSTPPYSPSR